MYELIHKKSPVHSSLWLKSRDEFGGEWEEEISLNISKVFGEENNPQWEEAVNGYIAFCNDALKAQIYFEKHGRYKATSYADCVELCYRNPDYMKLRYLPGQYLSHYIWPHHQKMLRHYIEKLIPEIKDKISCFYEVGVGCGMYSQKSLEKMPECHGIGFDISGYALDFTYRVVKAHGFTNRYEVLNQDIIKKPLDKKADLVISQEVLEHLEDPENFIDGLFKTTRSGGWGYITAAINAAHTDHIYLYRSPDDLKKQIESCGWNILDRQVEENYPEKPKEFRPTIAGFFVKKNS
jgi:SAM-dependent methyltransferase